MSGRGRAWARLGRGLVVGGVVSLLLAGAGGALLFTEPGHRLLERGIEAGFGRAFPQARLEITGLHLARDGRLGWSALALRDATGQALVQTAVVALQIEELSPLGRSLQVEQASIDGLVLDLRSGEEGLALSRALGLGQGPPSDEPWQGLPGRIGVDELALSGATLRVDGARLDRLEARTTLSVEGRTVRLDGLEVDAWLVEPRVLPLSLRGDVLLEQGDVIIPGLRLVAEGGEPRSALALSGRVNAIETAPVMAIDVGLEHLSDDLVTLLAGRPVLRVDLSAEARLTGPLEALVGKLSVDAGGGGKGHGILRLDLAQSPTAWGVDLDFEPVDLDALLVANELPLSVKRLELRARGSGISWPAGITAHIRSTLVGARVGDQTIDELNLTSLLYEGRFDLLELGVNHMGGTARAVGSLDLVNRAADLQVELGLTDLAAFSRLAGTPLSGSLSWGARLEAEWSEALVVKAGGPLQARGVRAFGARVGALSGPFGLRYDADGFALAAGFGFSDLESSGVRASSGEAELTIGWSPEEGTRVLSELEVSSVRAEAAATTLEHMGGVIAVTIPTGGEPAMTGTLALSGLSRSGMAEADRLGGELGLVLRDGLLDADLRLRDASEREVVGLVLGVKQGERTEVLVRHLELEPVSGLRWSGEGEQRLVLEDGLVHAARVQIDGSAGGLMVDLPPGGDRVQARLSTLDLGAAGRIAAWAGSPDPGMKGELQADLSMELGADGRPTDLDLKTRLSSFVLTGSVEGVSAELSVRGPAERPEVALDVWGLTTAEPLLRAEGSLPVSGLGLDCSRELDLRTILTPARLDTVSTWLPVLPALDLRYSADLRMSGPSCDPQLDLVAAASGPLGPDGQDVRLDIQARRRLDQLETMAFVEDGFTRRLLVSGGARTGMSGLFAAFREGQEVDASVVTAWVDELGLNLVPLDLSLQDISRFADLPGGATGRLAGGFQVLGSPLDPRLSGAVQLIGGELGGLSVESALLMILPNEEGYQLSTMLSFPSGIEGVPSRSIQAEGLLREGSAEGPIDLRQASLTLRVEGTLPLQVLDGMVEGVDAPHGDLDLAATVVGPLSAPVLNADLTMLGGRFDHGPSGLSFSDIDFSLNVVDGRLTLRRLELQSRRRNSALRLGRSEGSLLVEGTAELDGFQLVDIRVGMLLDELWVLGTPDREVALSGRLRLDGDWPAPRLTGDLSLAASQIRIDETSFAGDRMLALDPALRVVRPGVAVTEREVATEETVSFSQVDVDVSLDLLRNLRLRATVPLRQDYGQQLAHLSSVGLDADMGGELRILQGAGGLDLQGEIETLRGSATVLGVPFEIKQGKVSFVGGGYDDPLIDIIAVRNAGTYGDVDVTVSGRLSDLEIDPSSTQYPDKQDVVTLLLFGKPASEMDAAQGSAASQVIGATVSALSGQLEQAIGATLFDELRIDPAGAVRVGWSLNSRLFLRLEQRVAAMAQEGNRTELTLEYLITRRMYAEFVTGDRAASSAHLFWRWRF